MVFVSFYTSSSFYKIMLCFIIKLIAVIGIKSLAYREWIRNALNGNCCLKSRNCKMMRDEFNFHSISNEILSQGFAALNFCFFSFKRKEERVAFNGVVFAFSSQFLVYKYFWTTWTVINYRPSLFQINCRPSRPFLQSHQRECTVRYLIFVRWF